MTAAPAWQAALSIVCGAALLVASFLGLLALLERQTRELGDSARLLLLGLVPLRFAWAFCFLVIAPGWVLSTDGVRYLEEIREIARAPLAWNPLDGSGPLYLASAKLGMPWIYGTLAHLLPVDAFLVAWLAGVVFSCLTFSLSFELAREVSRKPLVWILTTLLVALHPISLYWSGRLVRENLDVCLVAFVFLLALRSMREPTAARGVLLLLATLLLSTIRAQTGLFGALALGAVAIFHLGRRKKLALGFALAVAVAIPFLARQIHLAGFGPRMVLDYLRPSSNLFLAAAGRVLASSDFLQLAPHRFGWLGSLLAPASLLACFLLAVAIWQLRPIFRDASFQAGTLIFTSLLFLAALADLEVVSFRARAAALPLLAPVLAATAASLFARLGPARTAESDEAAR